MKNLFPWLVVLDDMDFNFITNVEMLKGLLAEECVAISDKYLNK
jgi:hypothetical protein